MILVEPLPAVGESNHLCGSHGYAACRTFLHLQNFKLEPAFLLECGDQRLQVLAESPQYIEPSLVMSEPHPIAEWQTSPSASNKWANALTIFAQVPYAFGFSLTLNQTLTLVNESRGGNRGFQVVSSRCLKFDSFNDISNADFPPCSNADCAPMMPLGERESFRLLDDDFEFLAAENGAETPVK
jgi:hypothetical protein